MKCATFLHALLLKVYSNYQGLTRTNSLLIVWMIETVNKTEDN